MNGVFSIDPAKRLPKYRQIIENVESGIETGVIEMNSRLPSINEVCKEFSLSRDTVIKAYNHLKQTGILVPVHGKGFYIQKTKVDKKLHVMVIFDVLNAYKEDLLEGFRKSCGSKAEIKTFFHNFDPEYFCDIIRENNGLFERYVIMPFSNEKALETLGKLDENQVLILDRGDVKMPTQDSYSSIVQDFDQELENALSQAEEQIKQYKEFVLIIPENKNHPKSIKTAFTRFCKKVDIKHSILKHPPEKIEKQTAYFVIEDRDLVSLVKDVRSQDFKIGKDIGILSYNDTHYKEVIDAGISVISTDFSKMGETAGKTIFGMSSEVECMPTQFIARESL